MVDINLPFSVITLKVNELNITLGGRDQLHGSTRMEEDIVCRHHNKREFKTKAVIETEKTP